MTSLPRPLVLLLTATVLVAGCATPAPEDGGSPPTSDDGDPTPGPSPGPAVPDADPSTLMAMVETQVYQDGEDDDPRYRTPGTAGHAETIGILEGMMADRNLTTETQRFQEDLAGLGTVNVTNLYGVRQGTSSQEIWLAAHWDSRAWADGNREACTGPEVLGANDGAAGVAVVLHAIDLLEGTNLTVRVALFDAEDQGGCGGSAGYGGWAVGSTYAAEHLTTAEKEQIAALILVDMPGGKDLEIRREGHSQGQAPELTDRVFEIAAELNATRFIDEPGPSITDDHVPFLDQGVPAVDLIHLDRDDRRGPFPWTHHTIHDTPENLSGESMAEVTEVVVATVLHLDRTMGT